MRLRLHAPAKLNLGLRVVGRRADGYHLLDTVFHALDLHDTLWLDDAPELSLAVLGDAGGLPVPGGDDNLVVRAARAFFARTGLPPAGRLTVRKRIPAGAGLGGGSSDAAATLLLLQHRWGNPLSDGDLAEVAVHLGADVPFFLRCGTQHGTGIGDVLVPLPDVPPLWFVLVLPPFGTSTRRVFENYGAQLICSGPTANVPPVNPGSPKGLWVTSERTKRWQNDLEASAEQLYPELARLREIIVGAGFASVSMSGSGSTWFVSFADAENAAAATTRLQGLLAGRARVLSTRSGAGDVVARVPSAEDEASMAAPTEPGG